MTTVFKASDWLNGQLSSVMQLDSNEALCMEYHVYTSSTVSKSSSIKLIALIVQVSHSWCKLTKLYRSMTFIINSMHAIITSHA